MRSGRVRALLWFRGRRAASRTTGGGRGGGAGGRRRRGRLVVGAAAATAGPRDGEGSSAHVAVVEIREEARAHVKRIAVDACWALVLNLGLCRLSVGQVGDCDRLSAPARSRARGTVERRGNGDNVVRRAVGLAASTLAGLVICCNTAPLLERSCEGGACRQSESSECGRVHVGGEEGQEWETRGE